MVGVVTVLNRQGNLIIELLCTGRITFNELEYKRIKRGRHKEDIYHIQHINSLYFNLKRWVTTKYLSNHLKLNK